MCSLITQITCFLLLFLTSCNKQEDKNQSAKIILSVGNLKSSENDLELRKKLIALKYGYEAATELVASSQLIHGFLYADVLNLIGKPITEEQITNEVERINRETRDPETLAKIKSIFGGDKTQQYRKIFILPDFANTRYSYQIFPQLDHLHKGRKEQIAAILDKTLKNHQDLKEFEGNGVSYRKDLFSKDYGVVFYHHKTNPITHKRNSPIIEKYEKMLSQLKEGQMFDQIIEEETHFSILRFIGYETINDHKWRVIEQLVKEKVQAEEYFWQTASQIKVWVYSKDLREELKSKISWGKLVNFTD